MTSIAVNCATKTKKITPESLGGGRNHSRTRRPPPESLGVLAGPPNPNKPVNADITSEFTPEKRGEQEEEGRRKM
eukprot:1563442-Pyramimonas_sp.AAC.1